MGQKYVNKNTSFYNFQLNFWNKFQIKCLSNSQFQSQISWNRPSELHSGNYSILKKTKSKESSKQKQLFFDVKPTHGKYRKISNNFTRAETGTARRIAPQCKAQTRLL